MRGAEKHLLAAVRDRIRAQCGYKDEECQIELDEMAPATVGQVYVAVTPGGCRTGNVHATCGGVRDLLLSVNAFVIRRIRNVPRDRLRNVFAENLGCLDDDIDKIIEAVDWRYEVVNAANAALTLEGLEPGFLEKPLIFTGLDDKPRLANPDLFAGAQQNTGSVTAGMVRAIRFGNARHLTYVGAYQA